MSPSSFGNAPLSCNMFSLERFHGPFCAMNPPISKSFHNQLYSFPCDSSFFVLQSSSLSPPWPEPCHPQGSVFVLTSCRTLWCLLAPLCSSSSMLVPVFASHSPSIFLHKIKTSPCLSILLTTPCPSRSRFISFPQKYCQNFRPCAISLHFHALTASCTRHASILVGISTPLRSMLRLLPFLIYENIFFWLRLELCTNFPVFHQTVKAGCILQGCIHLSSLSLAGLFLLSFPT